MRRGGLTQLTCVVCHMPQLTCGGAVSSQFAGRVQDLFDDFLGLGGGESQGVQLKLKMFTRRKKRKICVWDAKPGRK